MADKINAFYGAGAEFSAGNTFTSSEIAQQPEIWRALGGVLKTEKTGVQTFLGKLGNPDNIRIILTGAGSSAYAGEAAAAALGKEGLHCEAIATTDIVSSPYSVLLPNVPTLLVSFARSGNSPESSQALKYARGIVKNLYELAIVCDGSSALAKLTRESSKGFCLVMPEGSNDKGFAMTSSITAMTIACFVVFSASPLDDLCRDIENLAGTIEKRSAELSSLARKWAAHDYKRLIVLGSGSCKGLAREAALKSMELSAGTVNTNYESAMGFRHGPKAVINDSTLTIHFISPDLLTSKYDRDLLNEIIRQKKGNRIISLSAIPLAEKADEGITINTVYNSSPELFSGLSFLVFCQMLAMFKSQNLGFAVDNPVPGGELTRIVSGVTLYDLKG
ncbi:tagatose-6-phosphate ketose isomerase [Spirochaetia bacterium]|nr:tagatose-6-phosphate ketose isomerase [Spirochaetia bacterium]